MKHRYLTLIFACLITSSSASQNPLDNNEVNYNFPGGVVEFFIDKKSDFLPEIRFGIQEPVIIDQIDSWRILVGLSLEIIPGEYLLYLKRDVDDASSEHIKFLVEQKTYPTFEQRRKNDKNTHQTHPNLSELQFSNSQQPNLPLKLPVNGPWNTQFGSAHHNTKQKTLIKQNHIFLETSNIISIHAPENALVSNIIINSKDKSSTIFLDHGRGLFSIIGGLTDINVEIGNGVLSGAVIGKVTPNADYSSATVSTRLLTWQCILNGTYVNPIILTKL